MRNVQYHPKHDMPSSRRVNVLGLLFCTRGPEFHLIDILSILANLTPNSRNFSCLFDLSFHQKLEAGQHLVETCKYKEYFQNETLCKFCFRMLRDKILFVIKLQNLKQQVSFRHPSRRNEHTKMWETHPNDYWVFSKMADLLSLICIPWSSTFQDGGWVKFPPWGRSGCQIPYPHALHWV